MTRRDFAASIAGAIAVLAITAALAQQPRAAVDSERLLFRAIALAVASVAVDSERTAVAVNDAVDQIKELQDRVAALEKRLADPQRKR